MTTVLAVDPGREKCGIAVVEKERGVLWREIAPTEALAGRARALAEAHGCAVALVGNGTSSRTARETLRAALAGAAAVRSVEEYRTTDLARRRYWQENPPRGWRRLLPVSMQVPPVPVDDYAAVILAERFLGCSSV